MRQKLPVSGTSRRDFLKQMGLLSVAAGLPPLVWKCASDSPAMTGTGIPPYSVWEEMLMALETSPDHLEGRKNR